MSRSSPCFGGCPCFSTNRCISSKPAMMRSSRGGRPSFFSATSNSASSAASSSRSGSLIATLFLEPHEGGRSFGHALFPRVLGGKGRQSSALFLECCGPDRQFLGFVWRQTRPLGGDGRLHLFQAVLAHGLGEDCVGFAEGIDAVDQV